MNAWAWLKTACAHAARVVVCLALFATAAVAGSVIHLNLPAAHRLAAHVLNEALKDAFRGTLRFEEIRSLHLGSVRAARARLFAPRG